VPAVVSLQGLSAGLTNSELVLPAAERLLLLVVLLVVLLLLVFLLQKGPCRTIMSSSWKGLLSGS
jgi:hypothetical protein